MPRIRTLKPEIASDRKLASISRGARYTFVLMITQADDYGMLLANGRQLLGSLYPHDESMTLRSLSGELLELLRIDAIRVLATVDGAIVVQIAKWERHQVISHKGKSLIMHHLAEPSGDPLELLRNISGETPAPTLDLGPRTLDLGSRTIRKPKAASGVSPDGENGVSNWVARIVATWEADRGVGSLDYGHAGRRCKAIVAAHPVEEVCEYLESYLMLQKGGRGSIEEFVKGYAKWKPEPMTLNGVITAYGKRVSREEFPSNGR